MKKFFLIEVEPAPDTRWLEDDIDFASTLCMVANVAVRNWTTGPEPEVSVKPVSCEVSLFAARMEQFSKGE